MRKTMWGLVVQLSDGSVCVFAKPAAEVAALRGRGLHEGGCGANRID